MKHNILFKCVSIFSLFAFFLCSIPENPDNPDNSGCSIQLKSIYDGINDTLINDSTGGIVTVKLKYRYSQHFDSVNVTLISDAEYMMRGTKFDTSITLTGFKNQYPDSSEVNLRLKTPGKNHVKVYAIVSNGRILYDSAIINVFERNTGSINRAPVSSNISANVIEDSSSTLKLIASDPETAPSALIYSILKAPLHGRLDSLSRDSYRYIPAADYYGPDTFTYLASDGALFSNPALAVINIEPVNDKPVAQNQAISTELNIPKTILLKATDVDDTVLIFKINILPKHGVVDTAGIPNIKYTPSLDFKGIDTIGVVVSDKSGLESLQGIVTVVIGGANLKPVAQSLTIRIFEDKDTVITLMGSDLETAPAQLLYTIYSNPKKGTLGAITANKVQYIPSKDYSGLDEFYYKVNDGTVDSDSGKVSIIIDAVNDIPIVQNQSLSTPLNTPITLNLKGSDVEDSSHYLKYSIVRRPANGIIDTSNVPSLIYTPSNNFKGTDSVWFTVQDKEGGKSSQAFVSIDVGSGNQKPVALPVVTKTIEDIPVLITFSGSDPETPATNLTYTVFSQPKHGVLSKQGGGQVIYTPAANFNGTDTFFYVVNDGFVDSDSGKVSITIDAVNDTPVVVSQSLSTGLNKPVTIVLHGSDIEDTGLLFHISKSSSKGTLDTVNSPSIIYTPSLNFKGVDTIYFLAQDKAGLSSLVGRVVITIAAENQKPFVMPLNVTVSEDKSVVITFEGSDIETPAAGLVYSLYTKADHGTISAVAGNKVTYTPSGNYSGTDTFFYIVNDGTIDSDSAKVTITITPVNDAPAVQDDLYTAVEGGILNVTKDNGVLNNDIDPEGDDITAVIKTSVTPSQGTISLSSNGAFIFTPAAYVSGIVKFTYVAVDKGGDTSAPATVTIVIQSVNNKPFISGNSILNINEGAQVRRVLTGSDPDGTVPRVTVKDPNLPGWIIQTDSLPNVVVLSIAPTHSVVTNNTTASFVVHLAVADDSVTVNDSMQIVVRNVNQKPAVAITSPKPVDTVIAGSSIALTVTASDADGSIAKVVMYQNGVELGSDVTSPYTFSSASLPYGIYKFVAAAIDNSNDTAYSTEAVVKVCRWDYLQRSSYLINHYTFDINGDAIYATYDSTSYTTRIFKFSTTGVWQEVTSRVFTTTERPLFGSMQSIKVAFTPANQPVVAYYHKSADAASTSQHNKFIVGTLSTSGVWNKVCDTIDTLESMRSFNMDLVVSSTGVVTLSLIASYTRYTLAGPVFVQNGKTWMKLGQPLSGTPVSLFYDNNVLYAASHNYGYGYTTYMHKLSGQAWVPVGGADGSIVYATYLDKMSFSSTGVPYVATRLGTNAIYTMNGNSWSKLWPLNSTPDSVTSDFDFKVINNQVYSLFVRQAISTTQDTFYFKRLSGSDMVGVFNNSGMFIPTSSTGAYNIRYSLANNKQHLVIWYSRNSESTSNYYNIAWVVIPE